MCPPKIPLEATGIYISERGRILVCLHNQKFQNIEKSAASRQSNIDGSHNKFARHLHLSLTATTEAFKALWLAKF